MKKILFILMGILAGISALSAEALTPSPIRFAGVWFYRTQNEQEVARQFPVGRQYGDRRVTQGATTTTEEQHSRLTQDIYTRMQAQKQEGGQRLLDRLATGDESMYASRGDALVMACALNYEHVEVQKIPVGKKDVYKIMAEIGFDLVLCNFHDRRIAAILPMRCQIMDASESAPTETRKHELLKHLYETQVADQFITLASKTWSDCQAPRTVGIGKLDIREAAMAKVPEQLKNSITTYYSSLICSAFYSQASIPVLPYSGGNELLYYTMREQVDDASSLDTRTAEEDATISDPDEANTRSFILKKPDYTLDIIIPDYQTQVLEKKKYKQHLAFVAACRITLKQQEEEIGTSTFFDSVQGNYAYGTELGTPWLYYQAATDTLLKKAANDMTKKKGPVGKALFTCTTNS